MPVLFIFIGPERELVRLCISLNHDVFGFAFLLGIQCGDCKPAESQFGLNTKKAFGPFDECSIQWHVYITAFDQLNDIIFLPFVLEFQCVLKIKGGLGIIVDLEFDLVANLGDHIHLNLFIKVKIGLPSLSRIQHGVIPSIRNDTEVDLGGSLGADVNGIVPEDCLKEFSGNMNLGNRSLCIIYPGCCSSFLPVTLQNVLHILVLVLAERHGCGNPVCLVPDFIEIVILVGRRVVFYDSLDVWRVFKI